MDQLLDPIREVLEGPIDFEGQKRAEEWTTILLTTSGVVALIVGYVCQNIHYALYSGLGGAVLTALIIVPPYSFYNKHPAKWLPSRSSLQGVNISFGRDNQ